MSLLIKMSMIIMKRQDISDEHTVTSYVCIADVPLTFRGFILSIINALSMCDTFTLD